MEQDTTFAAKSSIDLVVAAGHHRFFHLGYSVIEERLVDALQPISFIDSTLHQRLCDLVNDSVIEILDAGLCIGFELGIKQATQDVSDTGPAITDGGEYHG